MKKITALLLACILTACLFPAGSASAEETWAQKEVPLYCLKDEGETCGTVTLYYPDDDPYTAYADIGILSVLYPQADYSYDAASRTLTRDKLPGDVRFDPETNCIYMDAFSMPPSTMEIEPLPMFQTKATEETGDPDVFSLNGTSYRMTETEGGILLPVTVLSALFAEPSDDAFFTDGENMFLIPYGAIIGDDDYAERYEELFVSMLLDGPFGQENEDRALAQANYDAILFRLNNLHGGRARWQQDFDAYLEKNYPVARKNLLSGKTARYTAGLIDITLLAVDDGHTGVSDTPLVVRTFSQERADRFETSLGVFSQFYSQPRKSRVSAVLANREFYAWIRPADDETVSYYEDMAVITFDSFTKDLSYWTDTSGDDPAKAQDTLGFLYRSFREIAAHEPRIRTVVMDVTANSGGLTDGLLAALGFMLDSFSIMYTDPFTGCTHRETYDICKDSAYYAEKKDYDFYVFASDASFSCGNLLPFLAQAHGIPVIGARSGGGGNPLSCFIDLYGGIISYSASWSLCFEKEDGTILFAEDGAEPDIPLDVIAGYDLAALYGAIQEYRGE